LRLSLCEYNTSDEIDFILETLPVIAERLREMSPFWERIIKGEIS
jgi:cysteine desulfurase